jgi:hypothetical protein
VGPWGCRCCGGRRWGRGLEQESLEGLPFGLPAHKKRLGQPGNMDLGLPLFEPAMGARDTLTINRTLGGSHAGPVVAPTVNHCPVALVDAGAFVRRWCAACRHNA